MKFAISSSEIPAAFHQTISCLFQSPTGRLPDFTSAAGGGTDFYFGFDEVFKLPLKELRSETPSLPLPLYLSCNQIIWLVSDARLNPCATTAFAVIMALCLDLFMFYNRQPQDRANLPHVRYIHCCARRQAHHALSKFLGLRQAATLRADNMSGMAPSGGNRGKNSAAPAHSQHAGSSPTGRG